MDAALKALLDPPADVKVTFLNVQKYINKHYIKAEKPTETPAAAGPSEPKAKRPTVKKNAA